MTARRCSTSWTHFRATSCFRAMKTSCSTPSIGVLNLQERQRIAVFVRRDPLERFVSCLVFAPRERYDSNLRRRFAAILEKAFAGQLSAFYTHLDNSALARIHFIIRTTRGQVPAVDTAALERELAEAGRTGPIVSRKRRSRRLAKRKRVPGCVG